ncbi:hypothetical protein [Microbacterium sp. H1-D42]|uniref:hypothetical protein n=1 Tax=Microbacterium sp. H1-D42 TaxID=2925844 RepID=UPI001F5359D6|nr:hypothetical protein [Microbacterium sp. H1-D42]UNK71681.1 hypothetical protein MNR00_04260 [Microbacterium sp. H1-D42]
MAFHFIQPGSLAFLATPLPDGTPRTPGTPRPEGSQSPTGDPVRQLGDDYRRWSRLLVGAGGVVLAAFGALTAIGIPFSGVRLLPSDIAIAVLGGALGIWGIWILVRLQRSGRAVLKALASWTVEPYRTGASARTFSGWVGARTVNFEPPVFARIATSAILGLCGIFGLSTLGFPTPPGALNLIPAAVSMGIVLLATAVGQLGGVMHLVAGLSEADPLWVRIRDAARR